VLDAERARKLSMDPSVRKNEIPRIGVLNLRRRMHDQ
jgi:hypothetical protein